MALRAELNFGTDGLPSQIHNPREVSAKKYAVNHELQNDVKNAISIFCGVRLVYACTVTYYEVGTQWDNLR